MIHQAADLMKLNWAHLDHSIWRYMSGSTGSGGAEGERKNHEVRPSPTPNAKIIRTC